MTRLILAALLACFVATPSHAATRKPLKTILGKVKPVVCRNCR